MKANEDIRLVWTGTARYDFHQATWAINEARNFALSETDRKSGGRNCVFYTFKNWPGQCLIYWTKARAIVVRFHKS